MTELLFNSNPAFTLWVSRQNILSSPFVLLDVGCQGGEHFRWSALGDYLELHAFDPLEEVIAGLRRDNAGAANKHYYAIALGNEDGERELFVQVNAYATSFYEQGDSSRLDVDKSAYTNSERRSVPMRRLDSLFGDGVLKRADFIKMDCEGFEPEVLRGSQIFLRDSGVLGLDIETNFNASPVLPRTHFVAVNDLIVEHRFLLFDIAFGRTLRSSFVTGPRGEGAPTLPPPVRGQPGTFNLLFARDLVMERDFHQNYILPYATEIPAVEEVLKSAIIFELYGLSDCAYDTLFQFRSVLPPTFDIDKALSLLRPVQPVRTPVPPVQTVASQRQESLAQPHATAAVRVSTVSPELVEIYNSTSWRVTKPLRFLGRLLKGN